MAAAYQRHDLVRLTPGAWERIRTQDWDGVAGDCIDYWADSKLPLVVGRQQEGMYPGCLQVGLPAPTKWGRQRLCLQVSASEVASTEKFPQVKEVAQLLDASMTSVWTNFAELLDELAVDARVYGSFGWQKLTGLSYVRPQSDIDLLLAVRDANEADVVTAKLQQIGNMSVRLDGEICFPDGSATAWREWHQWRKKSTGQILVKRLDSTVLETDSRWHLESGATPASELH